MKEERNIKVKLHDGSIIQMHTEERIIGHQLHEDALEIVVDPDVVFDDVLITLEQANEQIQRLETALFTRESYDKTVCELREELEQKNATIKKLQEALDKPKLHLWSELQNERIKRENAYTTSERLRKALEEAKAEYSKEGTDIQVLRRMIKIIDAALGEGEKQAEAKIEFDPETDPLLRIYQYIEKCGYTYSPQDVLVEYQKYQEGCYVSHTMKDCITNLEIEIKALLGEGDKE